MLSLNLFGGFSASLDGTPLERFRSNRARALLAYLACEPDLAHPRELLATLLWGDYDTSTAKTNLRVVLSSLGKLLDAHPALIVTRQTVQFQRAHAHVDCATFAAQVSSYLALDSESQAHALSTLEEAMSHYHGEFLAGFAVENAPEFDEWRAVQQEQYHQLAMQGLSLLQELHLEQANFPQVIALAQRQIELEPWCESAHRRVMEAYARQGNRTAALAQYELCMHLLEEELSIEPDETTVTLVAQIRAGGIDKVAREQEGKMNGVSPHSVIQSLNPYAVLSRLDSLPHQALFGVDRALAQVGSAVNADGRSWLVSIEGLGGIGKTSLADALVKRKVEELKSGGIEGIAYQDIGWVSAKQEAYLPAQGIQETGKPGLDEESLMDQLLAQLSDGPYPTGSSQEKRLALTQLLKEKVCLVVIDNLETAIDVDALLPLLRHLANPTKFLITSRKSLASQDDVFCYSLSELNEEDTLAFLRYEAENRGLTALSAVSNEQLQTIYATVGGNPLALKLVLGQLQFLPLEPILASLRHADTQRTDQLYTYIYWQAWQMLDATSRHLWLCMPVVPNATFAQLGNVSGLENEPLQNALMTLCHLSLVEIGHEMSSGLGNSGLGSSTEGSTNEPRYRLHRLTETFLMYEVVRWQEASLQEGKVAGEQVGKEVCEQEPALSLSKRTEEAEFFIQRILYMVAQWNEAEAVQDVDVTILDHEYESVVKAIALGLELVQGWVVVKPLIIAFTPFMERRSHWHTWHSILERAIDAAHRVEDVDGEITLTALLARLCQRESRPKDVVYYYRRVIRMARRSGNRFEEARACSNLGYAYIEGGRWWRSEVLSRHALKVFEELESAHGRAHTHNHLGLLYTRQKRWDLAKNNLNLACQIWEEQRDQHSLMQGYTNLGVLYVVMEDPCPAIKCLNDGYQIAQATGESSTVARICNNIAIAYRLKFDWQQAGEFANNAESLFRKHSDLYGLANVWHNLGLISWGIGKQVDALNYLEKAMHLHQNLNNEAGIAEVEPDLRRVGAWIDKSETPTPF